MIQFETATKTYNPQGVPVHALCDVSLSIEEGDYAAVMGPSGSGKSTFLTILGAMNPPTSGRVTIDGIDVYGLGHGHTLFDELLHVPLVFPGHDRPNRSVRGDRGGRLVAGGGAERDAVGTPLRSTGAIDN